MNMANTTLCAAAQNQFLVKGEDGRRELYAALFAAEMRDDTPTIVIGDIHDVDDVWRKRTVELTNGDGW